MAKHKPGTLGTRFTEQRKEIYLSELRRMGIKGAACLAANVSRGCVGAHRKKYPEFAEAELNATVAFKMAIEEEIKRRAMEGVAKPVFHKGDKCGSIREYSDRLLIELARRHIKEYRPNVKIDTTHSGAVAIGLEDLSRLPREGRDILRKLLDCELDPEDDDDASEEETSE